MKILIINKVKAFIFKCKPTSYTLLMLSYSPYQVAGNANIKDISGMITDNIDGI